MDSGSFQCSTCMKVCKTKGGLTRHVNSKHKVGDGRHEAKQKDKEISKALFIMLVNQSSMDLSKDFCYPPNVRSDLASFKMALQEEEGMNDEKSQIFTEIKSLYQLLSGKGNVEKFFSKFYSRIVPKASSLFYPLSGCTATLLSTKLAEKLVVSSKKDLCDEVPVAVRKETLSDNEKAALQYLGGYVLSNLNKKIYKSKHHKSNVGQQHLSILQAGHTSQLENTHRLVDNINRGGLWKITETVQNIFTIAELEFCTNTNGITNCIDSKKIVETLCVNQNLLGLYQTWTSSCSLEIEDSIAKDLLVNLLTLYVKVRSFSYAKDIINKFKSKERKTKSRSLRKEIQKATDKQTVVD